MLLAKTTIIILYIFNIFNIAVLLNTGSGGSAGSSVSVGSEGYNFGLAAVAIASMLSGLSAALSQRALVGAKPRSSVFFSGELAVYGILFLLVNLIFNNDIQGGGFGLFTNWTLPTLIPVITNVSVIITAVLIVDVNSHTSIRHWEV